MADSGDARQKGFFLDREESIEELVRTFEGLEERSEGQFVFVLGEAGIGKTSLVKKFLSVIDRKDTTVLSARGYEEQESPLFPFVEMMKNFLSTHRIIERKYLLDSILNLVSSIPTLDAFVAPAQQIVKEVRRLSDADRYSVSNNYSIFSNYLSILRKIAEKNPVILYIDDVQWLDRTSFELLSYLARKISSNRIMVILSYRTGYVTAEKEFGAKEYLDVLARIIGKDKLVIVELKSISPSLYPEFVSGFLGPHKFGRNDIRLLYEQTEGNPFFLRSVLELWKESDTAIYDEHDRIWKLSDSERLNMLPGDLFDTIMRRVKRVFRDIAGAKEILTYASVIGYRFELDTLALFLKRDQLAVFHVLQEIEDTYSLVRQLGDGLTYVFDHRKTQEAIYDSLGRAMAKECHAMVARFLEDIRQENNESSFAVAFHYRRAGDWSRAIQFLKISAEAAAGSYFYADAAREYEECFSIMRDNGLVLSPEEMNVLKLDYSRSLLGTNKIHECITTLNELVQQGLLAQREQAEAYLMLGRCYRMEGRVDSGDKAIQSVERSLNIYEKLSEQVRLGDIHSYLATVYDHFGHPDKATKSFEQAQIHFNQSKDYIGLARLRRKSGMIFESRRSIDFMKSALDSFDRYSMKIEKARCLNNLGAESFYIAEFPPAEKFLGESLELLKGLDSPEIDIPLNNLGLIYQQRSEYEKALRFFEDAHENVGEPFNDIFIRMNIANVQIQIGNPERSKQILVHLEPTITEYHEPVMNDYYGFNRSMVHYQLDEMEEASKWLLKFPPNTYKNDGELVLAKRYRVLSQIYEKMQDMQSKEAEEKSRTLFMTARPQKWFYQLEYYPCDIHIWD